MMRSGGLLLALVLAASAADTHKPQLDKETQETLALASSVPPEMQAAVLVHLIESGRVPSIDDQRFLLTQAFESAERSQEPVPLDIAPGVGPDTHAVFRSRASALKLDALSLEARILNALLTIDRPLARQLFARVMLPARNAPVCSDPYLPDPSAYFATAAQVAQLTYSPQEKKDNLHLQFLTSLVNRANSTSELAAFAESLTAIALEPWQTELIAGSLGTRMEAAPVDFRSFLHSRERLVAQIRSVAARSGNSGMLEVLARAYRKLVVTQLGSPCADLAGLTAREQFNNEFGEIVRPVALEEIHAAKMGDPVKADPYFDTDSAKKIVDAFARLRNDANGRPRSLAERNSTEFRHEFTSFVRDFGAWKPEGDNVDILHQKMAVFGGLLELAVNPEDRDRLVQQAVSFLNSSAAQRDTPAEWLWQAKALARSAGTDAGKVWASLAASGNPALVLFSRFQGSL